MHEYSHSHPYAIYVQCKGLACLGWVIASTTTCVSTLILTTFGIFNGDTEAAHFPNFEWCLSVILPSEPANCKVAGIEKFDWWVRSITTYCIKIVVQTNQTKGGPETQWLQRTPRKCKRLLITGSLKTLCNAPDLILMQQFKFHPNSTRTEWCISACLSFATILAENNNHKRSGHVVHGSS